MDTVFVKELADHLSSLRMIVLELVIIGFAFMVLYKGAIETLRDTTAEDPFLLLKLFSLSRSPYPAFFYVIGLLVPILAIVLGFDAINGEHNRRTLSRILAQPIYRDALLMGKFLAGLVTLAITLLCLWLLVIGLGIFTLGVPPGGEEIARAIVFLLITLGYCGVWLALAMLLSVMFRSAVTALCVAFGLAVLLTVLWPLVLAPALAQIIAPPDIRYELLNLPTPSTLEWQTVLSRLSPFQLFIEAVVAIISPDTRSLGTIYLEQLQGAVPNAPLPFAQSLIIAWPQMVGLIAATIVLFAAGYVAFQRQEVRA